MLEIKDKVKSILVIRSAPLPRTIEALKKLREEYSNAEISILVQQEVKDEIEKTCLRACLSENARSQATHRQGGFVDKVIVGIKRGRISLFGHLPLVAKLRREVFDLVAIIYNTEDISWYGNLRLFALAIRARERIGVTTENGLQPFSPGEVIFKDLILRSILKPLRLIFTIPNINNLYYFFSPLDPFLSFEKGLEKI